MGSRVFKNMETCIWCPPRRIRIKASLVKWKSFSPYIGILYPAPEISNPNFNFKLCWHKILPLSPLGYFLLDPTWILLGIGDSRRFFWGIPLCFPLLGFTRLLLSWGTTSIIKRKIFPTLPSTQSPTTYMSDLMLDSMLAEKSYLNKLYELQSSLPFWIIQDSGKWTQRVKGMKAYFHVAAQRIWAVAWYFLSWGPF